MHTARERRDLWRAAALSACDRTPVGRLACTQGFVLTHAQGREAGLAAKDIRRFVARREWTAPRRGVLCVLPPSTKQWQDEPHGLRPEILASAAALVRTHAVVSHECAALARGLDVLRTPRVALLTSSCRNHAGARSDAVVHAAYLPDDEIGRWFGTPLTRCARTVVDIARRGAAHGLVVADSALRAELLSLDELAATFERQRRWHGIIEARRILELASPLSESPLESCVRLFLADHRLPLPEQQACVDTYRGRYRVDGLWVEHGVVLEADGLIKYRVTTADEIDPLTEEKLRQEAIERAGYRVLRLTWADIRYDPIGTYLRICSTLGIPATCCPVRRDSGLILRHTGP